VFSKGYKKETDQGSSIWSCDYSDYEEYCLISVRLNSVTFPKTAS